jgi:hypothetical protein
VARRYTDWTIQTPVLKIWRSFTTIVHGNEMCDYDDTLL